MCVIGKKEEETEATTIKQLQLQDYLLVDHLSSIGHLYYIVTKGRKYEHLTRDLTDAQRVTQSNPGPHLRRSCYMTFQTT